MIERFNLYDVYGYLLPGLALLGCLWLPLLVCSPKWPQADLTAALAAATAGYIAGHLLQAIAHRVLPSGHPRYPSQSLLDESDPRFSKDLKEQLAARIAERYSLKVELSSGAADKIRDDAFSLCRRLVLQRKAPSYSEHFEGLYSLNRGLLAAFCFGGAYHLGWATGAWSIPNYCSTSIIIAVLILIAFFFLLAANQNTALSSKYPWKLVVVFSLLSIATAVGHLLGQNRVSTVNYGPFLFAFSCEFIFAVLCYYQYHRFAQEFAKAVYWDFLVACREQPSKDAAAEAGK